MFVPPAPYLSFGNLTDANFGTNNAVYVERVTAAWTPGLTWFNQPGTTAEDRVVAPHTAQSQLDLNLDVTNLVADMVPANSNHGFMLKLQSEVQYTSRIFVSSYSTTHANKIPKLVVVYK